jgi:hypothetical protein
MPSDVLNAEQYAEFVETCGYCGGDARPVEVTEHINERFLDDTEVGPFLEVNFHCTSAGCPSSFRTFVISDEFHRARVAVGGSINNLDVRHEIAESMAQTAARDLASAAALTAAMRIDLGKQIQYDRTFREVYAQQYPVMLIEATERVEREISAAS